MSSDTYARIMRAVEAHDRATNLVHLEYLSRIIKEKQELQCRLDARSLAGDYADESWLLMGE